MLLLYGIGFVAGLICGISPCILPVLPVVLVAGATVPGTERTDAGDPTDRKRDDSAEPSAGSSAGPSAGPSTASGGTRTAPRTRPASTRTRRAQLPPLRRRRRPRHQLQHVILAGSELLERAAPPPGLPARRRPRRPRCRVGRAARATVGAPPRTPLRPPGAPPADREHGGLRARPRARRRLHAVRGPDPVRHHHGRIDAPRGAAIGLPHRRLRRGRGGAAPGVRTGRSACGAARVEPSGPTPRSCARSAAWSCWP